MLSINRMAVVIYNATGRTMHFDNLDQWHGHFCSAPSNQIDNGQAVAFLVASRPASGIGLEAAFRYAVDDCPVKALMFLRK